MRGSKQQQQEQSGGGGATRDAAGAHEDIDGVYGKAPAANEPTISSPDVATHSRFRGDSQGLGDPSDMDFRTNAAGEVTRAATELARDRQTTLTQSCRACPSSTLFRR